ncbi:MAG: hypothetical protein AAGA68_02875 [Pseudomonadota bacterium]
MSESRGGKGVHLAKLAKLLGRSHEVRGRQVDMHPPDEAMLWFEGWQAKRLAMTYEDLEAQPRYKPAVDFFLSDIYGARDFSRRDDDVRRVYPLMSRVLSEEAIGSITLAMDLHAMSQELDEKMLVQLRDHLGVAVGTDLQPEDYAQAYRRVGEVEERQRQIELVVQLGRTLDRVVPNPMLYTAVKLAHGPAHMMGFGELQDFVERGFVAFRHMHGADRFLGAVRDRELAIHHRLMAGELPSRWFMGGDALEQDMAQAEAATGGGA